MDEWANMAHSFLYHKTALVPVFFCNVTTQYLMCIIWNPYLYIVEMFMLSEINNVNDTKLQLLKQFQ